MLQTSQRFGQKNQRTQRWDATRDMDREREKGGGLVIEGEREEEGERAVRRLQRLDSQVDCI